MPHGQRARFAGTCGWSRIVNRVIRPVRPSTHHQTRDAMPRARSATGSGVLSATHSAPCIVSAARAPRPTITVYQSRIPDRGPGRKSVHKGSKKRPSASIGTPRTTLPRAAPKTTARRTLDAANRASQNGIQTGPSMWFRNSIESPRRIKSHRTIISGR